MDFARTGFVARGRRPVYNLDDVVTGKERSMSR
jgi:hypothetical protein